MRKTLDISKFDIHWQVKRVSLRALTLEEKLGAVSEYFFAHLNRADRERILNYLEGLGMAYKGAEREMCQRKFNELSRVTVSDKNECSRDYAKHTTAELRMVLDDLKKRTIKWLKNGYRNKELLDFIVELCIHLDDKKTYAQIQKYVAASYELTNTHKFFF